MEIVENDKIGELIDYKEGETNNIANIKQNKANRLNTCVYVDYENIIKQLAKYKIDPIKFKLFEKIKLFLESQGLNIIDFTLYSNYDCDIFSRNTQTELQGLGLQTRHTSNKGKNSGDLEMSIDALKDLYKNDYIDVFVIMSCDRDMIPLIKAIKAENKISYVISTKIGFNKIVATYADEHQYIEELFKEIGVKSNISEVAKDRDTEKNVIDVEPLMIQLEHLFEKIFKFKYWLEYEKSGQPVAYKGIISSLGRTKKYTQGEVKKLLKEANELKYIEIYKDESSIQFIKKGINFNDIKTKVEKNIDK